MIIVSHKRLSVANAFHTTAQVNEGRWRPDKVLALGRTNVLLVLLRVRLKRLVTNKEETTLLMLSNPDYHS